MLRLFVKSRPYLATGAILFLAAFNTSNALDVPIAQVPDEIYDRYLNPVKADDPAASLRREADAGNALAAYYLALRHSSYCPRDLRIVADRDLAFAYMRRAAELSNRPRAVAVLALYHLNGWGTPRDLDRAAELATQAKAKGQTLGYRVLGEVHLQRAEARSAELTALPPGADLAPAARAGKLTGLETDIRTALENLTVAADRGNAGALKALARIHDQGDLGRPRNHRLATECYQRAALRRDERAARTLAERFALGEKAEPDLKLAYAWTLVEAQLTEEKTEPRRRRDELEKRLAVAEKLTAQELAAQWLAQMPSEEETARARLDPDR